jgi:cell division protease FtsH
MKAHMADLKKTPNPKTNGKNGANGKPMKQFEFKFEFNMRRILIWVLVLLLFVPFLANLFGGLSRQEQVPFSQLLTDIREGRVETITVIGSQLEVSYVDSEEVRISRKEETASLVEVLQRANIDPSTVNIEIQDAAVGRVWFDVLGTVLPLLLMVLFFMMIFRQARGAQDGIMGFGRSKAKLFAKGKQNVTFKDVGGVKEAKQELEEVVDFLKQPKKYRKVGARTPKGVLLVGPSGTGKTLLARAVAGEAGVPYFSMAGSEFMEMLVGVGASRVRDLFSTAKKAAPAIIFIDEIDAIGRMRGAGTAGGHDEREQTLNQILVEMDGFNPNDNVIVLAATNRGDLLDPALTRPGRFDRRVTVSLPDLEERKRIIAIHSKNKPINEDVIWDRVAKRTVGYSGADLENMLNEAAISAARNVRDTILMDDIEEAATKVKLGPEKRRLQSDYERKMTAYHEAGHALMAHVSPNADPVHRISIVSRGLALGYTLTPPEQDKYQQTNNELVEDIGVLLGGRTAEEIVFGELTGGAASDIEKATRIARAMVVDYGMSKLGPVYLGPLVETAEWGRSWMEPVHISQERQSQVDREVAMIIDTGSKRAHTMILKYRKELDRVSEALLERETLDGDEFETLMGIPKAKPRGEKKKELKGATLKTH